MTPGDVRRYLRQIGHLDETTCALQNGARFAVLQLHGIASELAAAEALHAAKVGVNRLYASLDNPRLEIWDHFTRLDKQAMSALPQIDNWFGARFDDGYREMHGLGLFRNALFVTCILHPENTVAGAFRSLTSRAAAQHPGDDDALYYEFEDVVHRLEAALGRYTFTRLGIRPVEGKEFSEVFEALHVIANNRWRPIGLSEERMGPLIVQDRLAFDDREMRFIGEHGPHYAAVLSPLVWPAQTCPVMFDEFREAPYGLTISHSWIPTPSYKALTQVGNRLKQLKAGNDAARSQILELEEDEDALASRKSVRGSAHFSIAVHARSLRDLDRAAAHAQTKLSNEGVAVVRETDGLKAAFYAQLPGNKHWRTRPGPIKSINAAALSAKHNVPSGRPESRWGAPVAMLQTTAGTEYGFHWHVQGTEQIPAEDLGSTIFIAPAGAGKTTLMGGLGLLSLRNPRMRVVAIDKGFGLSAMIRAAGGPYLVLRDGEPCLAPLVAAENTEAGRQAMGAFLRLLILMDGKGEYSTAEDEMLGRAVSFQLSMPPGMRSIAQVATMLGGRRNREGAGARLRRWCRGERLGWAFDGERDLLRQDARIMGYDLGAVLKNTEVCAPMLTHLFDRTQALINGDPIILMVDEAWQINAVKQARERIKEDLKTIRKREGVVVLATQSAGDALNSEIADDFRQQIPTKVFGPDDTATAEQLIDGFGLTHPEFLTVTQELPNMPHTFLFKRPSGSFLCKFDLSGSMKSKVAVLSARESTYALMNDLIAEHGEAPELWVPHFERLAPGIVDEPELRHTRELVS